MRGARPVDRVDVRLGRRCASSGHVGEEVDGKRRLHFRFLDVATEHVAAHVAAEVGEDGVLLAVPGLGVVLEVSGLGSGFRGSCGLVVGVGAVRLVAAGIGVRLGVGVGATVVGVGSALGRSALSSVLGHHGLEHSWCRGGRSDVVEAGGWSRRL